MVRIVGEKRRPWFAGLRSWLLCVGLGVMACTQTPVTSLSNPPRSGFCVFPQACYVRSCACDQGSACRYLGPDTALSSAEPAPTDSAVLCQTGDGGATLDVACLLPEQVCVARGEACATSCASKAQGCAASGDRFLPQRRGGDGGMQTYCPRVDQLCCPGAAATDGGANDGGADAGLSDLMSLPG